MIQDSYRYTPKDIIEAAAELLTEVDDVAVQDGIIRLTARLLIPEVAPEELGRWIMDMALMSALQE